MAVTVSESPSIVFEKRRELAEYLSEDKMFCENALERVVDSIIKNIETITQQTFIFFVAREIKTAVVGVQLNCFKEKCMNDNV